MRHRRVRQHHLRPPIPAALRQSAPCGWRGRRRRPRARSCRRRRAAWRRADPLRQRSADRRAAPRVLHGPPRQPTGCAWRSTRPRRRKPGRPRRSIVTPAASRRCKAASKAAITPGSALSNTTLTGTTSVTSLRPTSTGSVIASRIAASTAIASATSMREHTEGIEARREREYTFHRIAALGRLVADNSVEGGRDADRAARIGPDRDRDQSHRHGNRRARGRTTGNAWRFGAAPGIARRAVMRVEAKAGEGELGHAGTSHRDHACGAECGDDRRVPFRGGRGGENARARRRHLAGDIEQILPGERHAVERTEGTSSAQPSCRRFRLGAGMIGADASEETGHVGCSDGGQRLLGERLGIEGTGLQRGAKLQRGLGVLRVGSNPWRRSCKAAGTATSHNAARGQGSETKRATSLPTSPAFWSPKPGSARGKRRRLRPQLAPADVGGTRRGRRARSAASARCPGSAPARPPKRSATGRAQYTYGTCRSSPSRRPENVNSVIRPARVKPRLKSLVPFVTPSAPLVRPPITPDPQKWRVAERQRIGEFGEIDREVRNSGRVVEISLRRVEGQPERTLNWIDRRRAPAQEVGRGERNVERDRRRVRTGHQRHHRHEQSCEETVLTHGKPLPTGKTVSGG